MEDEVVKLGADERQLLVEIHEACVSQFAVDEYASVPNARARAARALEAKGLLAWHACSGMRGPSGKRVLRAVYRVTPRGDEVARIEAAS